MGSSWAAPCVEEVVPCPSGRWCSGHLQRDYPLTQSPILFIAFLFCRSPDGDLSTVPGSPIAIALTPRCNPCSLGAFEQGAAHVEDMELDAPRTVGPRAQTAIGVGQSCPTPPRHWQGGLPIVRGDEGRGRGGRARARCDGLAPATTSSCPWRPPAPLPFLLIVRPNLSSSAARAGAARRDAHEALNGHRVSTGTGHLCPRPGPRPLHRRDPAMPWTARRASALVMTGGAGDQPPRCRRAQLAVFGGGRRAQLSRSAPWWRPIPHRVDVVASSGAFAARGHRPSRPSTEYPWRPSAASGLGVRLHLRAVAPRARSPRPARCAGRDCVSSSSPIGATSATCAARHRRARRPLLEAMQRAHARGSAPAVISPRASSASTS